MNRNKRRIAMILILSFALAVFLAGCKGNDKTPETVGSVAQEKKAFSIGCMPLNEPAVQIVKELLEAKGYQVDVVVFDGNHLPAVALKDKNLDSLILNHLPWINTFNQENQTELTMVEPYTYYSYFAIYSQKHQSLDAIPDNGTIAIGGDPTNMDRSLRVLRDAGLITLGDKSGAFYSMIDIEENPKNLQLLETEVTATVRSIADADAIVTFSSTMKMAGFDPKVFLYEDPSSTDFPTGFVVNKENAQAEWIQAAVEVTQSDEFKQRFNDFYGGAYKLFNDVE